MLQGGPGAGEDGMMAKSMEEDVQGEVEAGGDMAGGAQWGGKSMAVLSLSIQRLRYAPTGCFSAGAQGGIRGVPW